jgi:predicted phosphoribosyltransferase
MHYTNRFDAALKLIPLLEKHINKDAVILAVPRGGVPVGFAIAKKFAIPLDLLLTKKIGHPMNSEVAIGAVSLEDEILDDYPYISEEYINTEIKEIRAKLKQRFKKFMGNRKPIDLKNKTVIIVDDGIATGNTLLAAIQMVRNKMPKKIVVAVPVAPDDAAERIKSKVDAFICPLVTADFIGVGGYYFDFSQVSDEDVLKLMTDIHRFQNKTVNIL